MVESLYLISTISYVLAGVFFVVALILWIKFDIPNVIGDLSGKNAKKSIRLMREDNVKNGNKVFRMNMVPNNSRKLLNKTEEIIKLPAQDETEKLHRSKATEVHNEERFETMVLGSNMENASSVSLGETVMLDECNETELLATDVTAKLDVDSVVEKRPMVEAMTIIDEVVLVHTTEII